MAAAAVELLRRASGVQDHCEGISDELALPFPRVSPVQDPLAEFARAVLSRLVAFPSRAGAGIAALSPAKDRRTPLF
ncbi:hypothetical protein ACP70R_016586 [Stipagrostis hirtigluma subsp. patula]